MLLTNRKVLATTVIYPTPPQSKVQEAKSINSPIDKFNVDIISIGNGTASRETEIFVNDMPRKSKRT